MCCQQEYTYISIITDLAKDGDLFWVSTERGNVGLYPLQSKTLIKETEISLGKWQLRGARETEG